MNMTLSDMKKIAELARIKLSDEELERYAADLQSILGYVDQVNQTDVSDVDDSQLQVNIARIDADANPSGEYLDAMIADAPASQDGFYKVPKIL